MIGFKVCESCALFSPFGENVNCVWYLNVVMLYIIYMLYILLERRHWGTEDVFLKSVLSPQFFYLSSIKRKLHQTFIQTWFYDICFFLEIQN